MNMCTNVTLIIQSLNSTRKEFVTKTWPMPLIPRIKIKVTKTDMSVKLSGGIIIMQSLKHLIYIVSKEYLLSGEGVFSPKSI